MFVIKEREIDINAGILRAKKTAEELVAKARQKAVGIREKAEQEGAAAAKSLNHREAAKTKRQAEKIRTSAATETDIVREEGKKNMDRAAALIVDAIVGR
jgi:vacuolar-type H+-ATPase subunit H